MSTFHPLSGLELLGRRQKLRCAMIALDDPIAVLRTVVAQQEVGDDDLVVAAEAVAGALDELACLDAEADVPAPLRETLERLGQTIAALDEMIAGPWSKLPRMPKARWALAAVEQARQLGVALSDNPLAEADVGAVVRCAALALDDDAPPATPVLRVRAARGESLQRDQRARVARFAERWRNDCEASGMM